MSLSFYAPMQTAPTCQILLLAQGGLVSLRGGMGFPIDEWQERAPVLMVSVEPWCEELKELILENDISKYKLHNADETGLHWKSLPNNTLTAKKERSTPRMKASKLCVSLLLSSNANGSP